MGPGKPRRTACQGPRLACRCGPRGDGKLIQAWVAGEARESAYGSGCHWGEPCFGNIRSLRELPPASLQSSTDAVDRKYAVVVDCVGSTASLRTAVDQVVTGGRIHVVGMTTPTIEFPAQQMVSREITITTSYAYTREMFRAAAESAADLVPSLSLMQPVVCGLQDAAEHFEALLDKNSRIRKVVICP